MPNPLGSHSLGRGPLMSRVARDRGRLRRLFTCVRLRRRRGDPARLVLRSEGGVLLQRAGKSVQEEIPLFLNGLIRLSGENSMEHAASSGKVALCCFRCIPLARFCSLAYSETSRALWLSLMQ
jgi:hypothetical protein